MRTYATPNEFATAVFMQETSDEQNTNIPGSTSNYGASIAELENELKKQKPIAEKGAKLMEEIWGDKFQSDSLY